MRYTGILSMQVVSGCHGSVVSVWDTDSGEKTIQFSRCHGNMEITAMAFDTTGRRLVTGGRDGSLKMWNFNNGACLCVLDTHHSVEVCVCVCVCARGGCQYMYWCDLICVCMFGVCNCVMM